MRIYSDKLQEIEEKMGLLKRWMVEKEGFEVCKWGIDGNYRCHLYLNMWQTEAEMLRFAKELRTQCYLVDLEFMNIDILKVEYYGDDTRGDYRYEVILVNDDVGRVIFGDEYVEKG